MGPSMSACVCLSVYFYFSYEVGNLHDRGSLTHNNGNTGRQVSSLEHIVTQQREDWSLLENTVAQELLRITKVEEWPKAKQYLPIKFLQVPSLEHIVAQQREDWSLLENTVAQELLRIT
jgi:ureidoglycolate hydrolase